MSMEIDDYLDSMSISLDRKIDTLQKILDHTKAEEELLKTPDFDLDKFSYHMDEKDQLIDLVNILDDGFDKTYVLVKDAVKARPGLYAERVKHLQEQIRTLTDIGTKIEVLERRNMPLVDKTIREKKQRIKKYNVSQKAVATYYKQVSGNIVNRPKLMDDKN
jgi:hypothetical protein